VKPTRDNLSVHGLKATSIPPSRRFTPTIFSLGFRWVCTPPSQRLCFISL